MHSSDGFSHCVLCANASPFSVSVNKSKLGMLGKKNNKNSPPFCHPASTFLGAHVSELPPPLTVPFAQSRQTRRFCSLVIQ